MWAEICKNAATTVYASDSKSVGDRQQEQCNPFAVMMRPVPPFSWQLLIFPSLFFFSCCSFLVSVLSGSRAASSSSAGGGVGVDLSRDERLARANDCFAHFKTIYDLHIAAVAKKNTPLGELAKETRAHLEKLLWTKA